MVLNKRRMHEIDNLQKHAIEESGIHNCNRCHYQWSGKLKNPKTCANPKCRTPYWNKPRIRTQNKVRKSESREFYFYFKNGNSIASYFFRVKDSEITCKECNHKTCRHVFEIISHPIIREEIVKQGIKISRKYENDLKELAKNTNALIEFVQNLDQTRNG